MSEERSRVRLSEGMPHITTRRQWQRPADLEPVLALPLYHVVRVVTRIRRCGHLENLTHESALPDVRRDASRLCGRGYPHLERLGDHVPTTGDRDRCRRRNVIRPV